MNGRLARLREKMAAVDLDGFLVSCAVEDIFHISAANRRYISGFTGSMGQVLVTMDNQYIVVDFRYFEQAERESPQFRQVAKTGSTAQWLTALVGEAGMAGKRIGFEPGDFSVFDFEALRKAIANMPETDRPTVLAAPPFISELRAVKDAAEIETISRAVALGDEAFENVARRLEPGWTELQVAWEIEAYARQHGAEFLSFPTIVAAGPHGAMPHAMPTGYKIKKGDPVVIDMGVIVDGYCSDLTRTIVCGGKPSDPDFLKVHEIVLQAQLAAEEQITTAIKGDAAHMIAHNVIAEAGYGENFGHGLGHGVGLQVHEAPRLARTAQDDLHDGMIVTVEPGIYLTGRFGVRIEDQCVIENGRIRPLSKAPKDPVLA